MLLAFENEEKLKLHLEHFSIIAEVAEVESYFRNPISVEEYCGFFIVSYLHTKEVFKACIDPYMDILRIVIRCRNYNKYSCEAAPFPVLLYAL